MNLRKVAAGFGSMACSLLVACSFSWTVKAQTKPWDLDTVLHQMDVYVTWFGPNKGTESDPTFPAVVDAIMQALRTSQPNPYQATDPNTGVTSTIYNVGENLRYRVGVESVADQRFLRYDALLDCAVWEIINA